ncbi:putative calcium-binding protein [Emericellopsis cladophorae]|uniref:Calcium-binding protein n=1 Tax=Emericellopsis cladophorae TaxID=2686198 RepID=A0A9P9Y5G4_9HYPO|nr:putative calcium-binding protein [Emericellopsis cladophorae]KAI6783375.1 putative calcium-binding protein [Emericellopsis cladophorae]
MATEQGVESLAAHLNLTPDEKRLYGQLFRQADTGNAGVVTGEVAVKFFEKTRLDSRILGEIWQIADKENRGFLTPAGFGIVLRLIGHAQAGREPTTEGAFQQGPLPRFDGIDTNPPMGSPTAPAAPIQAQTSGGAIRIPPLTPEKVYQYGSVFERQPLVNGTLAGDQAKQIFEKSGLPNEVLGRIWMLADTEQRGALVQTEFVIAMHLLTSMKTGALRALPNVLPAPLYEAATRRGPATAAPRQSPTTTGISAIPRQMSGHAQPRASSPLGRPPITAQTTGGDWLVTQGDKVKFDQIFADLDKGNKGYITGEEAVPFFSQSNLGEEALAQIWDLSDIRSSGHLNRDEFAVAMFLIRQQRGNRTNQLPATLPASLVPPSLRQQRPQTAPSSAFSPPPVAPLPQPPKSALDDLFGLQSSPSSPPPPAAPQTTDGSNADPFAGGAGSAGPSSPIRTTTTGANHSTFPPAFIPNSSFGRGLTHQPSGNSATSQPIGGDDLLGGDDDDESKKITGDSTELANLSNQISSLAKQTQDTQGKRATTQTELNQTNSQKQNFEQRLSQLRTLYEKEAEQTRLLEEQLKKSREDTQKLQSECMRLDGSYRDAQAQHQEVSAALQADQQENARLRERIRVVNAEIAQLKPQIDKLKSDARQQKGLAAINKKQLSTTEGERNKLKAEADDLSRGVEEAPRQAPGSSAASPKASVASPALSTASGNNPFFKRTASTDIMGAFASPPARAYTDTSFDDVFGPSQAPASSATPPPATTFKQQHTGNSTTSASSAPAPAASSPVLSRQATSAFEPPAPPESHQMNSSFLPLPDHSESLTSSRQVSPPASRGEGSVAGSLTPFPEASSNTPSAVDVPGAFPGDDNGDKDTPSATPIPTEHNPASPTEESKASENPMGVSDPFGSADQDQAKAKEEFDSAFAAFSSNKPQDKASPDGNKNKLAGFGSEFPPISELEHDDESDSESEKGGFEDNFAPPQKFGEQTLPETKQEEPNTERKSPEQASSPATITGGNFPASGPSQSDADHMFGTAGAAATQPQPSVPAAKGAFDDDDEFEGLEDAKEGSADDDFANVSRSGLDDFNPMFDSSPPQSQAKSDSTAFGNESSFDFISSNTTSGGPAPTSGNGNMQKGAETHDWDAIFAGLDSPTAAATTPPAQPAQIANNTNSSTNELAPPERPAGPGRALTEAGEHDDPILKDLMGLGYPRGDAVAALEKFDYNLEKAANHLASQA